MRKLIDVICVVYLNDILIYSNDSTKHWRHVRIMLKRFKQYQLYINLKKCQWIIDKIEFLNFIVFIEKIQMNQKRVKIIKKWFKSKIYRELQIFLDFVNFYRRFIYEYSRIIDSLTSLLKKNKNKKNKNHLIDRKMQNKRFVNCATFLHRRLF